MMDALEERARLIGEAAAARARGRVAATLRETLPEVAVDVAGEDVVLTGRIAPDDPRLRWIGSLLR
ncbi:hypothetical protein [Sphingomonas sp. PAMC 26617]|uniref:hypothetical protein n=1 Tax=Sphingomonas sp. PAMC 26617 TaxID=1112216 RepID=UPI0002F9F88E|nr:hypothetical protein [Sphingomonas sp. PAMC 26617]